MEGPNTCCTPKTNAAILCSLCLSCAALAAPPLTLKVASSAHAPSAENLHGTETRVAIPAGSHEHLDLRPPGAGEFPVLAASRGHIDMNSTSDVADYESKKFPSAHRGAGGSQDDNPLPSLGAESGRSRVMGRAEAFAQRFHREGLPVARLWENHSALVSLGLNQKGKPGLWLVQKTR